MTATQGWTLAIAGCILVIATIGTDNLTGNPATIKLTWLRTNPFT